MSYDFPFNLRDIAALCGISTTPSKDNEYVTCPFCGRKKKMNLKYSTGQYNCPACQTGGHMLSLYARLNNMVGSTNAEIVAEIKDKLNITSDDYTRHTHTHISDTSAFNEVKVDVELMTKRDYVYRAFLNKLQLADMHLEQLLGRGLDVKDIERWSFKSVPLFGYKQICRDLINEGLNLDNVGGFCKDESGDWTVNINPNTTGTIVPAHNIYGLIEGLQIRLDRPIGKQKYIWISSDGMPNGAKTSATSFFVGGCRKNDMLVITEGAFKAIIPNKVFGYSVLGIAGVNNQKDIQRIIPEIKRRGYTKITEAFDADFSRNDNVRLAKEKLKELMISNGFAYDSYEWDISKGKGLDDYALYILKSTRH